ncbi:hypothetical protein RHOSPDRAFT_35200 [Rhodotorula sp. JG-1b]|nr:hypothetical protein RHOSPDRAFT_35200 [Rhodotorula sp. JG-1b]
MDTQQAPRSAGHYTTLTDPTFLVGLESILQPFFDQGAPADEIRGIAQRAEAFYLSNHAEPDLEQPQPLSALAPPPKHPADPSASSATASSDSTTQEEDQPPYPPTFAELAHLIATGAPVPGIKDIPDQLAAEPPTESTAERKRKPWEHQDDVSPSSSSAGDQEQASREVARALGLTTAAEPVATAAEARSQDGEMQDA